MKLIKSKRGVNDVSILAGLMTVFIFLGVLVPYINADLEVSGSNPDVQGVVDTVGDEAQSPTVISFFDIVISIFTMFFWSFQVPFWLNMVLMVFRLTFAVILARNIWIGGGG